MPMDRVVPIDYLRGINLFCFSVRVETLFESRKFTLFRSLFYPKNLENFRIIGREKEYNARSKAKSCFSRWNDCENFLETKLLFFSIREGISRSTECVYFFPPPWQQVRIKAWNARDELNEVAGSSSVEITFYAKDVARCRVTRSDRGQGAAIRLLPANHSSHH